MLVGMPAAALGDDVIQEADRIGGAGVLGQAVVIEIHPAGVLVDGDVFQDGAEVAGGFPDQRLQFLAQLDGLGIAAALEVEDAVVAPAVLVVADQGPLGIGGQGGLAGAGQAEEQGGIAALADIGGAVHREHALLRQQVVQGGEDRFLDLAGVAGAADQDDALFQVEDDEDLGVRAILVRIGMETGRLQDGELGDMAALLLGGQADEQVAGEQAVPGAFGDDADGQAVVRVGAGGGILHEDIPPLEIGGHQQVQAVELFGLEGFVDLAPPDLVVIFLAADDELVVRRATGVVTGAHDDRAFVRQNALPAGDDALHQRAGGQVPVGHVQIAQALFVQTEAAGNSHDIFCHCAPPDVNYLNQVRRTLAKCDAPTLENYNATKLDLDNKIGNFDIE